MAGECDEVACMPREPETVFEMPSTSCVRVSAYCSDRKQLMVHNSVACQTKRAAAAAAHASLDNL